MVKFVIRKGETSDYPDILKLITELTKYNKSIGYLTLKDLQVDGTGKPSFFKTIVVEAVDAEEKRIVGYVLYYYIYSSFEGRSSYMEDLYVTEKYRFAGAGTALIKALIKDLLEVGCLRLDFVAAQWNAPSLKFYEKHGAHNLSKDHDWSLFRLEKNEMIQLAKNTTIKDFSSPTTIGDGSTITNKVVIRKGEKKDCRGILDNIIQMSHYANTPEGVTINLQDLEQDGFGDEEFYRCVVAEEETAEGKKIIGYAMYFVGYSAYVGRSSFLEDLFVTENRRHLGLGGALWKASIQDLLEMGCIESEFCVLNWNEPSIKFYHKHGAYNLTKRHAWDFYRFDIDAMQKLNS